MNKEAFVYIWNNLTDNKKYVGYHKGTIKDGYISSSHNQEFWDDFYDKSKKWKREILHKGSVNECLEYEQEYLKTVDIRSDEWYNNARGKKIIWSDSVRKKASESQKLRWENMTDEDRIKHSKRMSETSTNWWKSLSKKEKKDISDRLSKATKKYWEELDENERKKLIKKIADGHTGMRYHSDEWKQYLSDKMKGNIFGKYQTKETRERKRNKFLENNPGKNKSEETKKKISESKKGSIPWNKGKKRKRVECPHCGKVGGNGLMQRWHFDNCKHK